MRFKLSFILPIAVLIVYSVTILQSIAPFVFPVYFFYIAFSIIAFIVFSQIDFDILTLFSTHFYIASVVLLLITLIIGQVTRGAVRWIPIGPITIQTTELVRPFLLIFFANFLTKKKVNLKRAIQGFSLYLVPFFLIWFQPSLGVAVLTSIGFLGIVLASGINKKLLAILFLMGIILLPLIWFFLAPYQKTRVLSLVSGQKDKSGSSYNSIQSMISVGSGSEYGRGLGKGIQTQLAFLPERHTDFIFASISEELGFTGSLLLLSTSFFILYNIIKCIENANSRAGRAFAIGVFLTFFTQIFAHAGMNMGLLPISGLPFPLVSAGGSSLVATMMTLGVLMNFIKA